MKKLTSLNKGIKYFIVFFSILLLSSCEDDFTTIGGDFINSLTLPEPYVVQNLSAYSDDIKSVQTNTLNNYLLGEFEDPVFGNTDISILSQLELQSTNPDFGVDPTIDSVVLTLPFFSQVTGSDEDTGKDIYRLDSIFGEGSFKLAVYESNQFLRDIDPGANQDFEESQIYYSDQYTEYQNNIISSIPLTMTVNENGDLVSSPLSDEIKPLELNRTEVLIDYSTPIEIVNDDGDTIPDFERLRLSPRIRVKLNPDVFKEKIIDQEGSINLVSQSAFKNHFRGLYLEAIQQSGTDEKSMINFNLQNTEANISIYYKSLRPPPNLEIVENPDLVETLNVFSLNFAGNIINFYDNNEGIDLSNQDIENGEENLFIKGGQGVVTIIEPFNGPDNDNNGVADEIDELRQNNWLINEANLVLYIDEEIATDELQQPLRIFAYDLDRDRVLIDYTLDPNSTQNPFTSKLTHLGPLLEDDEGNSFYKIRITSHINNIINNDSTNTRIGVVMTQNVNQARVLDVRESQLGEIESAIESTISTPRGTVFHGNLSSDEDLRLKLQIYYTQPN